MKKLLLFIAAAVFAASAAVAQEVPQVEPVENGITIVVHIPDGSDCYGAPLWCGDNNNWSGEEMQAIDGYPNWYKLDVPGVSSLQGRALANFEGWENGLGNGWPTQYYDYEVLQEYTTADWYGSDYDNLLSISWQGIVYIDVKSWMYNPCISSREFKFTIVVPECTPEGQETVNIVGAFPDAEGNTWAKGIDFPIVEGKAEITITGQETIEWKVRLTDDWSQQAVECRNGRIWEWNNQVLGEAEGQVIVVEGWGGADHAIGDCFSDCKPLILSTNKFNLYPGESVKVSLEYKDSPVDATAAIWTSNNPEVFTIDETGLITGVATGQGTFTVTYDGLSATGYVKVLDEALLDIPVPDIEPVPDGITIAAYIPEGSDCNGFQWAGENTDWEGKDSPLTKVEGYDRWYKIDFADLTGVNGKLLATPESGEGTENDWATQMGDYEIMQESTATYTISNDGNIVASTEGIIYVWVRSWKSNPCEEDREYTFTVVVPECTPEGQETVNVVGSFPDADGNTWSKGTDFPIVDGKATITINGKETYEWKVRLTDDWSQQAVEWGYYEYEDRFTVIADDNRTLGEAEGKEIYIQGWGDFGAPLGDCFADMPTVTDMALSETELKFGLNNLPAEPISITATAVIDGSETDITELCEWSSSDETVATVENGKVSIVGGTGSTKITCDYYGLERTLFVVVKAPFDFSTLLQGDDYYIFQMDETTFKELDQAGKVTSDMRTNGAFEGDVLIPEDATRVNYFWNPSAEIAEAPQSGVNSFGLPESWFSIAAASPTPEGGWSNICGGLGIASATDTEVGKLQNLTPDHVLVVVLKGKYTPARSLQISMTPPAGGDNVPLFEITDTTGEYNDGDWEVFTLTYPDLIYMGIDLSQPITTDFWYPWAYVANGAGNRVDVDCVFFYVPGEMSAIDETGASSGNISVSASNGRIYCDEPFRVINLAGQDVTAMNGELQGTYIVVSGDKAVKVVVR